MNRTIAVTWALPTINNSGRKYAGYRANNCVLCSNIHYGGSATGNVLHLGKTNRSALMLLNDGSGRLGRSATQLKAYTSAQRLDYAIIIFAK